VWRYNFARPADVEWGEIYFGSGTKVGLVPMSPTLMYMFLVTAEPDNPRRNPEELADLMRDRLGDYTGRVGALREQIVVGDRNLAAAGEGRQLLHRGSMRRDFEPPQSQRSDAQRVPLPLRHSVLTMEKILAAIATAPVFAREPPFGYRETRSLA